MINKKLLKILQSIKLFKNLNNIESGVKIIK